MDQKLLAEPTASTNSEGRFTREHTLVLVLLASTALVFYLCFAMLRPFLAPLAWALALAVIAHPLHAWIERIFKNVNLSAGVAVIVVTIVLVAPTVFVIQQLIQEGATQLEDIRAAGADGSWRENLKHSSVGNAILWLDQEFDLTAEVDRMRRELVSPDLLRQSAWTIANILITMFTLFFLFRDRREARTTLISLVPLSPGEAEQVFLRVQDTIHATVYGSVMMAALQGFLAGLMFWFLGLPAPVLWGVVMGLLATVPNLGTFVVWAPVAVGLALQDEWTKSIILTVWGLTAVGLIDNLLYPIVVGKRLHMHSAPVFFAILGGLLLFGPAGLILGPVVFALAKALIEVWRRRTADGRSAEDRVSADVIVTSVAELDKPLHEIRSS